jgi:hypothetical protein
MVYAVQLKAWLSKLTINPNETIQTVKLIVDYNRDEVTRA